MAESNINDVVFVKLDHEKAQADPKASTSSQGQVYNPSMVPANVEVARKHGIAKKVYLSKRDDGKDEEGREVCVCCGLPVDGVPIPLMAGLEKLYHLGSGFALYFRFIKFTIALLILVLVVSGIFNLATNSKSGDCSESDSAVASYCTQGYILTYAIPNKRDEPEYLTAQAALNFVAIVLIVFFFHYLRYQFRKTEIAADDLTVTPSDYTIVIKEIPISTTNQEIIEWIQNIAMRDKRTVSIEKIDRAYDVDEYISLARELNAMEGFQSQNKTQSPKIQERLKFITNLLGEMKNGKKEIKKCPVVFVTFTLAEHAAYIKNKFAGSRTFEIFRSKNTLGYDHIKGARVVVERAPEPSDVLWLNLGYTTRQRQIRGFLTNIAAFLLIILSCGIIILVKWAKDTASTTYGKGSATIQILSIVSSIVIVITNAILTFTIVYLTKMEKSLTNSEYLRGVAQKLSVALFLNTALTSLFAELILVENPGTDRVQAMNFYGKGGLIESIFWVFITNAFLGPLLTVFDFGYFLKLYKQRSLEKKGYNNKLTQKQANELFEGPVLNMPAKFAAMIQVILMTTFYAPALPFALLITSAGLFLKYWSEKYALLRRNKMPVSLNDELTDSMVEYLEWAACTFAVGNLIYIYTLKDSAGELAFSTDAKILAWVGLGISVLNVFFPMETVNNKLFPIKDDVTENDTYEKVRIEFTTDYDMENPVSKSKALDNFMQKVKGQQQPPQLAKTNTNEFEVPDDLSDRHLMKPIEPEIDFASLDSYAASTAKASDATKVSFFEYYILSRLNRFGF